jgi:hypothetical protein
MPLFPAFPDDLRHAWPVRCYFRGCPDQPAPGVNHASLCASHMAKARAIRTLPMLRGIPRPVCLAGCPVECKRGKWKGSGRAGEKEFVPSPECELFPGHMLRIILEQRR